MRTAVTLVRGHGASKWRMACGPEVPIVKQKEELKRFLVECSHKEIAEVRYQESDGAMRVHKLRTPAEQEKREEMKAENLAAVKGQAQAEEEKPAQE